MQATFMNVYRTKQNIPEHGSFQELENKYGAKNISPVHIWRNHEPAENWIKEKFSSVSGSTMETGSYVSLTDDDFTEFADVVKSKPEKYSELLKLDQNEKLTRSQDLSMLNNLSKASKEFNIFVHYSL